jgi:EmrB/QacA subfamily drug resistance transporter
LLSKLRGAGLFPILVLLCAAQFMVVLDFSIVNVALPSIRDEFGLSSAGLQWVITGYVLTFGGFLLLGGRVADIYGRRLVFVAGLSLFVVASLAGGFATSAAVLVVARAVQGLGAAAVSPAALSILTTSFPEGAERNRALGIWGGVAAGGFSAGVILGGFLTEILGWEWVMFVNVPIGGAVAILAPFILQENKGEASGRKLDIPGAVSVTAGLIALVYALSGAGATGFLSPRIVLSFGLALALLAGFWAIELRTRDPLVPPGVVRRRTLTGANVVGLLIIASAAPMIFLITLYMQRVLGYSAIEAGLAWLPHGLASIFASSVGGRLATRIGVKPILLVGLGVLATSLILLSRVSAGGGFWTDVLPGTLLVSFGIILPLVAVSVAATSGVRDSEQGLASGLLSTTQQIGAALGLALLVAISATHTEALTETGVAHPEALARGLQYALVFGVGFPVLGLVIALLTLRENRLG